MSYHVLPGDSLIAEFTKSGISGDVIVCRECLVVGDVDADSLTEFWDQRARFILSEYAEDEIVYHETVADELAKLLDLDEHAEVNLWFEYELFCSVNMWFCLWLLHESGAAAYRVEPVVLSLEDRWNGFGKLSAEDLKTCYDQRIYFTPEDIQLGAALWNAFRKGDFAAVKELSNTQSRCFRYLAEVCQAAIDRDTRPAEILTEIDATGKQELEDIFPEFTRRAGVYGLGDLQVQKLLER